MKCVENSSQEFQFYSKVMHYVDALGAAPEPPCPPYDEVAGQISGNITASLCRDDALNDSVTGDVSGGGGGAELTSYSRVEMYLYTVVIPLICMIGIVGNTINLVVLTSIVRNKPMDRMERSATIGLLALAVSDLFFCIAVMPLAFVDDVVISDRLTFALVYRVYHPAVISTLITSSTWLTVVMAVSRYLAICHPLKARIIIGMRFAAGSIAVAFLFSILLNVPRFFHSAIACVDVDASVSFFPVPGPLQRHGAADQTYYAMYLVVGIILPLAVLAYSNFFLIRAIRNSRRMRRHYQRHGCTADNEFDATRRQHHHHQQQQQQRREHSQADTTNAITLTLTVIVIMYAVLVSPAEISNIFTQMIDTYVQQQRTDDEPVNPEVQPGDETEQQEESSVHPDSYNVAVAVGNTLQTLNFACNFVLYCAVNVHFRRIVREMVTCRPWWRWPVARPTATTAGTTQVGRGRAAQNTHLAVSLTTNTNNLQLNTISSERSRVNVSDVDEFDIM